MGLWWSYPIAVSTSIACVLNARVNSRPEYRVHMTSCVSLLELNAGLLGLLAWVIVGLWSCLCTWQHHPQSVGVPETGGIPLLVPTCHPWSQGGMEPSSKFRREWSSSAAAADSVANNSKASWLAGDWLGARQGRLWMNESTFKFEPAPAGLTDDLLRNRYSWKRKILPCFFSSISATDYMKWRQKRSKMDLPKMENACNESTCRKPCCSDASIEMLLSFFCFHGEEKLWSVTMTDASS